MKLSKREKVLIYLMILTAVLAGGSVVLSYVQKAYADAGEHYEMILDEKMLQDINLQRLEPMRKVLKQNKEFYEENREYLKDSMKASLLEQMMTRYLKQSSLSPLSMDIEERDISESTEEKTGQETEIGEERTYSKAEKEGIKSGEYKMLQIKIRARGKQQNFYKFLDLCQKQRELKIEDFSVGTERGNVISNTSSDAEYSYSITVVCYLFL